jgi:hypothetical protein
MAIGPTASHVGQPVASSTHGVADAATNSPEPIELVGVVKGTGGGPRGDNAGDGGNEEGSIALLARSLEIRLKAEYPLIYLPIVTNLTTSDKAIQVIGVCTENLNSDIVVMKPAKDRV